MTSSSQQPTDMTQPRLSKIQEYIWTQERAWALKMNPFLYGRVLKVGNGLGYLTMFLRRAGFNIVTLDIQIPPGAINKNSVVVYDGKTLPFKQKAFDCIIFAFVLHHTPNPFALLREAQRVAHRIIVLDETYDTVVSKLDLVMRDIYVNFLAGQRVPIFWNSYFRAGALSCFFEQTGWSTVHHHAEKKRTYLKELYVVQLSDPDVRHPAHDVS